MGIWIQRIFHRTLKRLTTRRLSDRLMVGEKARLIFLSAAFPRIARPRLRAVLRIANVL